MTREEFTDLTNIYPTSLMFDVINELYQLSPDTKEHFCEKYVDNQYNIAYHCQRESNYRELSKAVNGQYTGWIKNRKKLKVPYIDYIAYQTDNTLESHDAAAYIAKSFGFQENKIKVIRTYKICVKNSLGENVLISMENRSPYYNNNKRNYVYFKVLDNQYEVLNGRIHVLDI